MTTWFLLLGVVYVIFMLLIRPFRRDHVLDDPALNIKPPRYSFTGSDEQLAARTRIRRDAADAIRSRAAKVESGAKVGDILRIVKK